MYVRNNRGSAIPLVMIITVLVAVFSYVIFNMLQSRRQGTEDDLRILQSKMLAADLVELGKYFLLYERIIYQDRPLEISTTRSNTRKDFLSQSYGSLAATNAYMMNACGGFDANATEVGTLKANGSKVFCPYYLRNPLMDGNMFEDMMLKMWSTDAAVGVLAMSGGTLVTNPGNREAVLTKQNTGAYNFVMHMNEAVQSNDNQFIRLHLNQNIVKTMRQNGFKADLTFSLFGPSSGFKTLSNERFVNIQADVNFGNGVVRRSVNTTDTAIIYSATVKDFAIFIIYPEDSSGNPTNKFSESVRIGSSGRINGRVFFNGDIDNSLDSLPTFNETVVISGNLNVSGFSYKEARKLISEKFRKGIVMGFPTKRLINDGECSTGIVASNNTSMLCKNENTGAAFTVADYISGMSTVCKRFSVSFNNGSYLYNTSGTKDANIKEQCKGSAPEKVFLSGGAQTVNVSGSHGFIISPVKRLNVGAGAHVYGTILGGYINAPNGARFYSLAALRSGLGLPGIDRPEVLASISTEAERIMDGVGVPLINVAFIKEAAIGK